MAFIGVIKNQAIDRQSILKPDNCEIIDITKKEQLKTVNGVVILLKEKEELSMGIEWLLACREYPRLFIWFFSYENLETEAKILKNLGANGVFSGKENIGYLNLVIENMMASNEQFIQLEDLQKSEDILNFKNQSVLVNGIEKELTRQEFKLFRILYENKEICLTYGELQKKSGLTKPRMNYIYLQMQFFI